MLDRLKRIGRDLKREMKAYRLALKDPRTPILAKILLGLAVGYLLLPFDLVPDFLPVVGQMDDLVIVPFLVVLALRFIPKEVLEDCRVRADEI